MTRCPHCFHEVSPDRSAFVCTAGCESMPDTQFTRYHAYPRESRTLTIHDRRPEEKSWVVPAALACRKCGGRAVECCRECHYPFPPNWRSGEAICVAFAGTRNAGKTNAIATLVHALEQYAGSHGWVFAHATGDSRNTYEAWYQEPLFQKRGVIPTTARAGTPNAPQREPIVISLGTIGGRVRYVVLRDAAGEELQEHDDPTHLSFFSRADLVVLLFDPTQVQEVQDQVRDDTTVNDREGNPLQVFEHLQRMIGSGTPHLAVTLSKLDALWMVGEGAMGVRGAEADSRPGEGGKASSFDGLALAMANPGAAVRMDLPMDASSKDIDESLAQVNHEVRSLLLMLRAAPLVNAVERSADVRHRAYFALSALGHPPTAQGVSLYGIAPYRVLDPLLWFMRTKSLI